MDDDEHGLLAIGRFARLCGLSVVTLRHYAEVGVLEPAWTDDHSGYRYYRPSQVHAASTIKLLLQIVTLHQLDQQQTAQVISVLVDLFNCEFLSVRRKSDEVLRALIEVADPV